jgi:hypothetical protein
MQDCTGDTGREFQGANDSARQADISASSGSDFRSMTGWLPAKGDPDSCGRLWLLSARASPAWWPASLLAHDFKVVVLEARRRVGGRVHSVWDGTGRVTEAGGELIGYAHAFWMRLADHFRLGLSVLMRLTGRSTRSPPRRERWALMLVFTRRSRQRK